MLKLVMRGEKCTIIMRFTLDVGVFISLGSFLLTSSPQNKYSLLDDDDELA